jgi:hypothetical protein
MPPLPMPLPMKEPASDPGASAQGRTVLLLAGIGLGVWFLAQQQQRRRGR